MSTWWLSFADPALPEGAQFLGVVVIEAPDFIGAIHWCNWAGVNPGGEVTGFELEVPVRPESMGRLLLREEAEQLALVH